MDFKNFAYSTVATAPSSPTAGTSVTLEAGGVAKFPTVFPFYATVWPVSEIPSSSNAEIVKVTANPSGQVFTIVRQQEGTSARSIIIGDQIAQNITAATFGYKQFIVKTGTYTALPTDHVIICNSTTAFTVTLPSATASGKIFHIKNISTGTVTVDGDSSDTIDDITSQTIGQYDTILIIDYAANKWAII